MRLSYQVSLAGENKNPEKNCLEGDLERNLVFLKKQGYQAVELMTGDPEQEDFLETKNILERCEMDVCLICTGEMGGNGCDLSSPDPETREISVKKVKSAIDLAAYLGTHINAGRIKGTCRKGISGRQTFDWAAESFRVLSDYAQERKVRIALETAAFFYNDFINTCQEAQELIRAVDRKNFGLMLDVFHMNIEEKDLYRSLEKYGAEAFHVHLADSSRKYPGSGSIDFERIVEILCKQGYQGDLTLEIRQIPDAGTAARLSAEKLLPILARYPQGGRI